MPSYRRISVFAPVLLPLLLISSILGIGEAAAGQLTASWTDNSGGQAAFAIERRASMEPGFIEVAEVAQGVTTYRDVSVADGVTYCYRVKAFDGITESPYSSEVCAASMTTATYNVTITKSGDGAGTISSAPAGINCGADCSEAYATNTLVTLTATAAAGSKFAGWSGGCSGTSTCTIIGNTATSVTATFTLVPTTSTTYGVTITKAGTGGGLVASAPTGIYCGTDCTQAFAGGTVVTLTATAARGSKFAGWAGACSGTSSTCTVTASTARSVTATFNLQTTGWMRNGKTRGNR